ncbi:hypothetical protein EDC96DRAFT_541118 [Choanephora cucurbitarum]|nr:hypothetical protein EDC96DRAFT_541118 [Choanephora cucurbitarum]
MNQLIDKECHKKDYFKYQFPDGRHFGRFTIEPCKGLEDTFNKCNLDTGWALTGSLKKNIRGCPTCYKKCLGAVYCRHSHDKYRRLHLSGEEDKVLHEKVQNDQFIAPKSFSIGVTSLLGQFTSMAKEISSALVN